MPGYAMKTSPRIFTAVPEDNRKTFWFDGGKISFPMVRALRDAGFQKVNHMEDAQIVFQYRSKNLYNKLKPWQRLNHIPGKTHMIKV
jgi:coproporphyrinogen III oxidase|mmetsp:Transcript_30715/g.55639  ORF Transcript_30715/g.55639 Transcript_30715/m.55639 type:complete len:87 (-) Transcript_30715:309-569(-)